MGDDPVTRDDVYIDKSAEVHESVTIGADSSIWNWTKVREQVFIGNNCNIGQGVCADPGVTIGDDCSIHNNVSNYEGVSLGNRVFVGGQVAFTNDLYPRAGKSDWTVTRTRVEDGVSIGANATIICGVTVGTNCMIGAGAVVTKDVPARGLVVGQPGRLVDYVSCSSRPLNHDMECGHPPDSAKLEA
jgi:UDP-2-acetamido-3-amino-2,3-dideoxy-glucuronate N-acetyltransferase